MVRMADTTNSRLTRLADRLRCSADRLHDMHCDDNGTTWGDAASRATRCMLTAETLESAADGDRTALALAGQWS